MTRSTRSCASRLLVESAFDGRLDRRDLAAVERHLAGCAECAAWAAGIERLRAEVRRDVAPAPSPFELARARLELLRHAAADLDDPSEASRPLRWIAAAVVALGAVLFFAWPRTKPAAIAEVARFGTGIPLAAKVTFTASTGSDLSVAREARSFDLRLVDGTVALWVRKLGAEQRVLVTTSDGSVEVRGTIFRVTAEHGKLVDVRVDDGVVQVRRRDERHLLHAGEGLDLREPLAEKEADVGRSAPSVAAEPIARAAPRPIAAAAAKEAAAPIPSAAPAATPARPQGDATADDFARAVKNLDYADYSGAARELSTFVKRHPDDARAEDAAFLAVVALQKSGSRAEMRAAAHDYLRRFPNGARVAEVRRWADAP